MDPKPTFPNLGSQMVVRPRQNSDGRRSWTVTVDTGGTRALESFFHQCKGRLQSFTFTLPSGETVSARFDTDSLPMQQVREGEWRCHPFPIIELIGE